MSRKHRKAKLDPSIIRIGDTVKVKIPKRFTRVGYPLDASELADKLQELATPDLRIALSLFLDEACSILGVKLPTNHLGDVPIDIYKGVGRHIVKQLKFGGRTRSAHEVDAPCLRNQEFMVQNIKYFRGGEYYPGWGGDYNSDYEPAGLGGAYTIKVLQINSSTYYPSIGLGPHLVLADNCEKVSSGVAIDPHDFEF